METVKKPIVFISHSSKDERLVRKFKELLTKKLGNSVDIFVSSDGQSIRLGRNWVYEIEEALKNSKIMFVLLSPNSTRSNWTYFEAGYAYSHGIKVIPIGILGVNLSHIPPPVGLLQGFNITSADGLNNVISTINTEFGFSHEASFTADDYIEILGIHRAKRSVLLKDYAPMITEIAAEVQADVEKPIDMVADYFRSQKRKFQSSERMVITYGMSIEKLENLVSFKLDPNLFDMNVSALGDGIKLVRGGNLEFYPLIVDFVPWVNCIEQQHKVTSRIYKTKIEIGEDYYLRYSDTEFRVARKYSWDTSLFSYGLTTVSAATPATIPLRAEAGDVFMEIKYYGDDLARIPVFRLLRLLFEVGVLFEG